MTRSIVLLLFVAAVTGQERYDLGGPCIQDPAIGALAQMRKAENAGDWDRAIEAAKQSVRGGCAIEYRWRGLADALVQANRRAEASRVLAEMDARGFDLSPSAFGTEHDAARKFMETSVFQATALGVKLARLRKLSDERRLRARTMLAKLQANQRPPDNYIAKGACPFECCTYREWTVEQDADLVAAPGSTRIVGRAKKGTRVRGMTGEVHLEPQPVVLLKDGPFPKGSIAFVLDNEGEGFGHVWSRGSIASVFIGVREYCLHVSDSCWGETLFPASRQRAPIWWVKIRLSNGTIGWSDKADHFGNMDLCG